MISVSWLGQGHQISTQNGEVDVHITHNDKASADALDIEVDPKVIIVVPSTGQVPAIIVIMIHGVYGIHIWFLFLPQEMQVALTECELMIRTHQGAGPSPHTPFTIHRTRLLAPDWSTITITAIAKIHLEHLHMFPWSLLLTSLMLVLHFPFSQVLEG